MRGINLSTALTVLVVLFAWVSPLGAQESPCEDYSPLKKAYFGDTHVHTSYSQDANWRMGSSQTTPDDAYLFAKGSEISLPPYDENGASIRSTKLQRPLDFSVVTDHAENMDLVRICSDPKYASNNSSSCGENVLWGLFKKKLGAVIPGLDVLCANPTEECAGAGLDVWQDTIEAAERHNDGCSFTAFIGYEWTGSLGMANMHRNVVFRNSNVVERPISALSAPYVEQLWDKLDAQCRGADTDCDAITIPHNPNLSEGKMFSLLGSDGKPMSKSVAEQRVHYETLVELIQHKGSSECFGATAGASVGLSTTHDELCDFELLPYRNFAAKYLAMLRKPPENDNRYMREALRVGLRLENDLGLNPFTPGFIGSTDTHISAAGAVEENNYKGNHGAQLVKDNSAASSKMLPDRGEQNPGGLAVLYAEQNSRESLFSAMRRREAYATSGTRIGLRFFAGNKFPDDICQQSNMVEQGYASGVPMGAKLSITDNTAPNFLVSALQDAGTKRNPGTALQRIQIIKGWLAEDGSSQEQVFDVAGDAANGANVSLADCSQTGSGFQNLCATWSDPDFSSLQNSYYYARVLENPSCRWQQYICIADGVDCSKPDTIMPGHKACCDANVPKTIQERAWSSPIWVSSKD